MDVTHDHVFFRQKSRMQLKSTFITKVPMFALSFLLVLLNKEKSKENKNSKRYRRITLCTDRSAKSRRCWKSQLLGANQWVERMVNKLIPESNRKCKEKACLSLNPLHFLHDIFVRNSLNWRRLKSFMVKAVVLQKSQGLCQALKLNEPSVPESV